MGSLYPISTITVGSGGQANVEFTSIPSTYTHLSLMASVASERTAGTADDLIITYNGTSSGYTNKVLYAAGGTASGYTYTNSGVYWDTGGGSQFTSKFSNVEFFIPNYTNSENKLLWGEYAGPSDVTTQYVGLVGGTLTSTSAVSSIKIATWSGNDIAQYSKFTLYGLRSS